MAVISKINPSNDNGRKILNALSQIKNAIGDLKEDTGLRSNAIGVSLAEFESVFGVTANSQALYDRLEGFLGLYTTSNDFGFLRDLLDATTSA